MTEVKDKDHRSDKSDMEKPFNIEERMGKVEGILDQVKERLNHVEMEIGGLRGEIGDLRNHVDAGLSDLRREMDSRFTWVIGIMIIEGILILLTILFKIP